MKPSALILLNLTASIALTLPAHGFVISYTRDTAGRLREVNYGGASNTAFAYDANGNLLSRTSSVNAFLPLAGAYSGRVTGGTPTATNTGTIALNVTSTGSFTGTLTLGGVVYRLAGAFDGNGHATVN